MTPNPGSGGRAGEPPAFTLRGIRQMKSGAVVLDDVDLEIPVGRVTALVGPSGAGKTSLLRLLNRLDDPASGEIYYRGHPLCDCSVRELRRKAGFVFQTPVMFPGSVRDNLVEAVELGGEPRESLHADMQAAMECAELDWSLIEREGERLSVGERQRANIARALMTRPEVLLMDEPTSALDAETADHLTETIRHLSTQRGLTVVLITHRLAEARRVSDSTAVMEAGRVILTGPTPEVFGQSTNTRIRAFLESGRKG